MNDIPVDFFSDTPNRIQRSAFHEAGHAVYCWFYSRRDYNNPPFTKVSLNTEPNEYGVVPGNVNVHTANLPPCPLFIATAYMVGVYTEHYLCDEYSLPDDHDTTENWLKMMDHSYSDITDSEFDDTQKALALLDAHHLQNDAGKRAILHFLKLPGNLSRPISDLAAALVDKRLLQFSDPAVQNALRHLPPYDGFLSCSNCLASSCP